MRPGCDAARKVPKPVVGRSPFLECWFHSYQEGFPMNKVRHLALATGLAGLIAAPAAQAQSVYGELGYSALSASVSVPVLGVSVKSEPAMARAMIGISPFAGPGVVGMIGTGVRDDRLRGTAAIDSRGKGDEFAGDYRAPRLRLRPVAQSGRDG